ncbi:MAG: hypothetical protein IJB67_05155 [Firmicutes bacterium]|nr:hypothetical protein [Bacillota bacterium]
MIMFTITKPKGKLKKMLAAGALVLLLGVFVPGVYMALSGVGAMSLFAAGDAIADEPMEMQMEMEMEMDAPMVQDKATEPAKQAEAAAAQTPENSANADSTENADDVEITAEEAEEPSLWVRLKAVIFGEEPQVVPY